MEKITITTPDITLGQLLKLTGLSGGMAKTVITQGEVYVNGEIETRRGRKLAVNDVVKFQNHTFVVTR